MPVSRRPSEQPLQSVPVGAGTERPARSRPRKPRAPRALVQDIHGEKQRTRTPEPTVDEGVLVQHPTTHRSGALWGSVITLVIVIVGVWIVVFRWTLHRMQPVSPSSSLANVKEEVKKNLGDFQKSFEHVTALIEQRFNSAAPSATGTVSLAPDTLHALQERIDDVVRGGHSESAPSPSITPVPIDFSSASWQPFEGGEWGIRFKYPAAFALNTVAVHDTRIAAFVRRLSDGTLRDVQELVVDVFDNPTRKTLKEFYRESGRVNLFQSATEGNSTTYVDGIRAVEFHAVASVVPLTVVAVRRGTRVYEFSVLGTDAEHQKILHTVLETVRFE